MFLFVRHARVCTKLFKIAGPVFRVPDIFKDVENSVERKIETGHAKQSDFFIPLML